MVVVDKVDEAVMVSGALVVVAELELSMARVGEEV